MRIRSFKLLPCLLHAVVLLVLGCGTDDGSTPLTGDWHASLASPGGELPFTLRVREKGGGTLAFLVNGEEEAPVSAVRRDGDRVVFAIDWYDSEITAELSGDGRRMTGRWRKTGARGVDSTLPFEATREDRPRFAPATGEPAPGADAVPDVTGTWSVLFQDEDGPQESVGEFEQQGDRVTGTFLTPLGDYRYLDGVYEDGRLRLSTFDGAHAFLFDARAQPDGSLSGDFWSRDTYHATWAAQRVQDARDLLPDPFGMLQVSNPDGRFRFAAEDPEGREVTSEDPRFDDKVVLVNLFGSWCPNCNDEAPVLARWYRQYRDEGLEIVGLAFEMTGDPERDATYVRRFAERHGVEYPLLLAGVSDKEKAAAALRDLEQVIAYPTTLFLDRRGRVRFIHSGFAGPGTGRHHEELVAEMESRLRTLLDET